MGAYAHHDVCAPCGALARSGGHRADDPAGAYWVYIMKWITRRRPTPRTASAGMFIPRGGSRHSTKTPTTSSIVRLRWAYQRDGPCSGMTPVDQRPCIHTRIQPAPWALPSVGVVVSDITDDHSRAQAQAPARGTVYIGGVRGHAYGARR